MSDSIFNYGGVLLTIIAVPALGVIAKFFGVSFHRIAKWYSYVAIFAVLIVVNSIFFPFIGGKDYFFRYAVQLGVIAWIVWWAFEAKNGEAKHLLADTFKKPLVRAVTIFVGAVVLSALFALDSHAAFWSNYERGEGTFQILHYYLFFLLLATLFRDEKDWKNLFRFSIIAGAGMIGYGLLGNFSYPGFIGPYSGSTPPPDFWGKLTLGRFEGSLGNPAYVAPYLLFSMFFAAYLWLSSKISGTLTALKSWGYGILIAIFLLFFWLSQTRGAFLGLAAGVFVIPLYLAFAGPRKARRWSVAVLAVLIILGGGVYAVRNSPLLDKIPGGRQLQISTSDSSAQTRFWVWGAAMKGFLDRPIFGWGQENFTAVFDKYFNPNFFIPGRGTETWFDRAHSVFFDYLTETGIVGLVSYLGIFVMFAIGFFRKRKRDGGGAGTHDTAHAFKNALVIAIPVAYLVQGIAIFDVLPMYIPLFTLFAFGTYYFNHHESHV